MTYTYTKFTDKPGTTNILRRWLGYRIRYFGFWLGAKGDHLQLSGKDEEQVEFEIDPERMKELSTLPIAADKKE